MRALALAVGLALVACSQATPVTSPTPAPTHEAGTFNVTALLDLSGSRVPAGGPQRDGLQLWADQHTSMSPRVKLRIVDVGGSQARTLVELRRAAVEERADAIIVGASADDAAFADAVQLARLPVLFTLPVAEPAVAGGGWAFALAPTPADLAKAALDDAAARTVLTSTIVVSDESATAIPERAALMADLAKRSVVPTLLKATAPETSRIRSALATSSVVLFAGPAKTYLDAARAAPAGAFLYFSYVCDTADVAELRDASAVVTWPGSRWIASGTASAARAAFLQSFTDRAGGPPNTPAASAYDALAILASAAEESLDAPRVRQRIEDTRVAGIATTYSFSPTRHAGFATADLALLRYTGARTPPIVR
jgi:ABC-type branched-subunit amino acid transport system substrate-binding protein